jgi:hypothetical protein
MNLNILRKYIKEILKQELEEASVTGAIDGGAGPPKTPRAFRKKNSKKIKKAGFEDGHKKPAVFGFVKVNEAKFHIRTDFGSVLVDAGSKGEAKMIVAKKLKGGVKAIISVKRVGVSQAKQVDKKIEAHIPFHPGGKKTTIEDEPEEKRKKESVTNSTGYSKVNEGSMDWEKHFKGYNEKELKVISKFIWMNPQGIDGVIKMSKKKDFKPFVQKAAKKGLGESLTIKESVNKRIAVKEVYKWLKGLEEYRYRKIPNVDVRRITSFVNNGLSEIDLPKSLQKKWESAKYSKEKNLADRFVKQKISQKLTQTESKHPLKEQYDRLFTDRTVL